MKATVLNSAITLMAESEAELDALKIIEREVGSSIQIHSVIVNFKPNFGLVVNPTMVAVSLKDMT